MRVILRLLFALALALTMFAVAPEASARTVRWEKIEVRSTENAKRVEKELTKLLKRATKRADWGKGDTVKLSARLTKITWERVDDVLRVSVTVHAKIAGGNGARSHIRIGGHPKDKLEIEKVALKIVSDGLITRLSDMARTASAKADE
jgi:hypothetical protein